MGEESGVVVVVAVRVSLLFPLASVVLERGSLFSQRWAGIEENPKWTDKKVNSKPYLVYNKEMPEQRGSPLLCNCSYYLQSIYYYYTHVPRHFGGSKEANAVVKRSPFSLSLSLSPCVFKPLSVCPELPDLLPPPSPLKRLYIEEREGPWLVGGIEIEAFYSQ